jgi:hypothetical protein
MTACCAWCAGVFKCRSSGGSSQRFCSSQCRSAFWTAARRWVMRAVSAGLLSPEVLKGPGASVHAVREGFQGEGSVVG